MSFYRSVSLIRLETKNSVRHSPECPRKRKLYFGFITYYMILLNILFELIRKLSRVDFIEVLNLKFPVVVYIMCNIKTSQVYTISNQLIVEEWRLNLCPSVCPIYVNLTIKWLSDLWLTSGRHLNFDKIIFSLFFRSLRFWFLVKKRRVQFVVF